jgi:hypothetical protein
MTKSCKCDDEYLGDRCEIAPPCQALYIDYLGPDAAYYIKHGPFATIRKDGTWGSLEERTPSNELFLVYGRPVYAWSPNVTEQYDFEQAASNPGTVLWYVILYSGSRWYVTVWNHFVVLHSTRFGTRCFNLELWHSAARRTLVHLLE